MMLARELQGRGFSVTYTTTSDLEPHIAAQGFPSHVVDFPAGSRFEKETEAAQGTRGRTRLWCLTYERSRHQISQWLSANRPRFVLLDPLMWPYAPPLLEHGLPVLGLCTTFASADRRVPPVFSGLFPAPPPRILSRLAWLRHEASLLRHRAFLHLSVLLSVGASKWRDLDPKASIRRLGGRLRRDEYDYRLDVPELMLSPRELDFPRAQEGHARCYVGACVDTRRRDERFPWDRLEAEKVLVYCTLGTFAHRYRYAGRLLQAVVEAFRQRPAWQVLLQARDDPDGALCEPLPPNVLRVVQAPQLEVLSRSALCIHHGGLSTVREALFYGVPMVVFPCWFDQPGNAARVVYHRLGRRGDIRRVNASKLIELMDSVMDDPEILGAVARMKAVFRAQETCEAGIAFVDKALRGTEWAED